MKHNAYDYILAAASVLGAIVNENGLHWSAIVKHDRALWHVDSCSRPVLLLPRTFAALLLRYPATFAIETVA